mgnify:CR=1 FL=1
MVQIFNEHSLYYFIIYRYLEMFCHNSIFYKRMLKAKSVYYQFFHICRGHPNNPTLQRQKSTSTFSDLRPRSRLVQWSNFLVGLDHMILALKYCQHKSETLTNEVDPGSIIVACLMAT